MIRGRAFRFLQRWVVVTAVGWFLIDFLSSSSLFLIPLVLIGVGQWLVLRNNLANAGWWAVVTPVGLLLGMMVGGVLAGFLQDAMDGIPSSPFGIAPLTPERTTIAWLTASGFAGACVGALLGGIQWLVLRGAARSGGLWLLANVTSLALASFLSAFVPEAWVPAPLVQGIGSATIAVVTGAAIIRCLHLTTIETVTIQ